MIITTVPIVLAIVGLLIWLMAANGKAQEAGKLMFFAGILAFAFANVHDGVKLF